MENGAPQEMEPVVRHRRVKWGLTAPNGLYLLAL